MESIITGDESERSPLYISCIAWATAHHLSDPRSWDGSLYLAEIIHALWNAHHTEQAQGHSSINGSYCYFNGVLVKWLFAKKRLRVLFSLPNTSRINSRLLSEVHQPFEIRSLFISGALLLITLGLAPKCSQASCHPELPAIPTTLFSLPSVDFPASHSFCLEASSFS